MTFSLVALLVAIVVLILMSAFFLNRPDWCSLVAEDAGFWGGRGVARDGFEPPTQRFSVSRSTD